MQKQKTKQCRKKVEFSKLIYIFNLSFVIIVTGLSFLCVVKSGEWGIVDLSPITVICTSAFAELATFSVVYAKKAQAENVLKIGKQIQVDKIDREDLMIAKEIMKENNNNFV